MAWPIAYPEKIEEMGAIINAERQALGLQPLYMVPYLNDCANIRAGEVSVVWSHDRPNGENYTSVLDYDIASYETIQENLTAGYETAEGAMESFRGSPKHWEYIVKENITHMGIGLVYNPEGYGNCSWYWCQLLLKDLRGSDYKYEGQYLPDPAILTHGKLKISVLNADTGENFPDVPLYIKSQGEAKHDLSGIKVTQNGAEVSFDISYDKSKVYFSSGLFPTDITDMPSGDYSLDADCPSGYYFSGNLTPGVYGYIDFTMKNDGSEIPNITLTLTERKLSILKTDADTGNALPGAVLELSSPYSLGNVEVSQDFTISEDKKTITFTSGNSPVVFSKISSGDYKIHEVSAPPGYSVTDDINISVLPKSNSSVEIANQLNNVTFSKLGQNEDGTQSRLSGASFQLKYSGENSLDGIISSHELIVNREDKIISWTSSDSDLTISGLPQGTYELTEISAPDGFIANKAITFSIAQGGKVIDAVNAFGDVIDNNIRIYNKRFQPKTVFQYDYITIYDSSTKQNQFDTHGLGVLTPTECTVTENLNGKWELSITHPFDSDNKYQYIKQNNIIKALGQLFTLKTVTFSSGERNEVTGKAEQIFYQQNDWWIFPDSARIMFIPNNSVLNLLDNIDAFASKNIAPNQTFYNFSWDSDMIIPESYPLRQFPNSDGVSPVSVIMDSGGILSVTGGELYRDNFYFSIRERMENSNDNAFEIRIGNNLRGIKRTVDITTVCTFFKGYDNYGNWFAVSWDDETVSLVGMPHSVIRSKKFSYTFDDESVSDSEKAAKAMELLVADVMLFFNTNCKPLISYEVDIEDVQNNPDFAEFSNKPDYRVGNIGTVYDERFGEKIRLKITRTTKDAVTGKTKSVTFGDNRSFTNQGYNSAVVDMNPVVQQRGFQLTDSSGAFVYDSENNAIIEEAVHG